MINQIIETWGIHNRINIYLLDSILKNEYLQDMASSKGRNVGDQFAHIHNVRLMWLNENAPEISVRSGLSELKTGSVFVLQQLIAHIHASGNAIELLLEKGFDENNINRFKPHPMAFFGYLISHESHHRGQIVLSLKQSGHPISKNSGFGLWQWGNR